MLWSDWLLGEPTANQIRVNAYATFCQQAVTNSKSNFVHCSHCFIATLTLSFKCYSDLTYILNCAASPCFLAKVLVLFGKVEFPNQLEQTRWVPASGFYCHCTAHSLRRTYYLLSLPNLINFF